MTWLAENLALIMFATMFVVIFCGYPVAFVLGGTALAFALLAWSLGEFNLVKLHNILFRMWGGVAVDPVLVSLPMFIFMGALLERSGVAKDMLDAAQVMLRRTPGGLAIAVMVMGTILAAPIGVVGASVILLSLISLPPMLKAGYDKRLSIGTIGSAGTLGILIPPSINMIVYGVLTDTSIPKLYLAGFLPGVVLAALFSLTVLAICLVRPSLGGRPTATSWKQRIAALPGLSRGTEEKVTKALA